MKNNTQKTVMLNSFQHPHLNLPLPKEEEILKPFDRTLNKNFSGRGHVVKAVVQDDNRMGFTLIELLVVVLIIGILAAVAVPQYQKAVAKARVTEAIVALKALSDAEEVYFLANGTYTGNLNALDTSIPPTSNYYTYSCFDNQYSSCIAKPTQDGYPVLEFVFLNHWTSNRGKHWCQTNNMGGILTEKGKQKALDICKTFGPQETSLSEEHGPYYIIQ